MKKLIIAVFALSLFISFTGCNIKEMIGDKIGEAVGENVLEEAGGVNVDIDGDTIKFKNDEGEEVEVGSGSWPDSDLAKVIPEFKSGKITGVVDSSDGVMVVIEEVSAGDYESYASGIKKDFTEDTFYASADDYLSFGGTNGDGVTVMLQYDATEKSVIINVGKSE